MAERRMFSKTIVDSDLFLNMPATSQLLYFHLALRADDDGFINNPKSLTRMCGCHDDDMNMLITRGFIIPFPETGVVVVTHWNIHNKIKKDRYTETANKKELSQLVNIEGAYMVRDSVPELETNVSNLEPKRNQNGDKAETTVSNLEPQDRLGKDRLGKDRLGKVIDYEAVKDSFNRLCPSFPEIKTMSEARKRAVRARLNTYSMDDLLEAFRKAEASDFLKGKNKRDWSANFDWMVKDANLAKILDGNYDNKDSPMGKNMDDLDDLF